MISFFCHVTKEDTFRPPGLRCKVINLLIIIIYFLKKRQVLDRSNGENNQKRLVCDTFFSINIKMTSKYFIYFFIYFDITFLMNV